MYQGAAKVVALRKESVDRNNKRKAFPSTAQGSLSARRAWIEIFIISHTSVLPSSLSARRAWIEISCVGISGAYQSVALRKESVDRNKNEVRDWFKLQRRSPQGERG